MRSQQASIRLIAFWPHKIQRPGCAQIECFNFLSCPGGFAQELEARGDARITGETFYVDAPAQFFPAVTLLQARDDELQCEAMERIALMSLSHDDAGKVIWVWRC